MLTQNDATYFFVSQGFSRLLPVLQNPEQSALGGALEDVRVTGHEVHAPLRIQLIQLIVGGGHLGLVLSVIRLADRGIWTLFTENLVNVLFQIFCLFLLSFIPCIVMQCYVFIPLTGRALDMGDRREDSHLHVI